MTMLSFAVVPGNFSVGVWTLPFTPRVEVAVTGPPKVVFPLTPIPFMMLTALAVKRPVNVGLAFGARFVPESVKTSVVPPSVIPSRPCTHLTLLPDKIKPEFALATTVPVVRVSCFPLREACVAYTADSSALFKYIRKPSEYLNHPLCRYQLY